MALGILQVVGIGQGASGLVLFSLEDAAPFLVASRPRLSCQKVMSQPRQKMAGPPKAPKRDSNWDCRRPPAAPPRCRNTASRKELAWCSQNGHFWRLLGCCVRPGSQRRSQRCPKRCRTARESWLGATVDRVLLTLGLATATWRGNCRSVPIHCTL